MRCPVVYNHLPSSVVVQHYVVREKPVRKRLPLAPTTDQVALVKRLASHLPLELFLDKRVLSAAPDVLLKLCQLSESSSVVYQLTSGNFVCIFTDSRFRLIDGLGRKVCEGDMAALYAYASRYARKAIACLRVAAVEHAKSIYPMLPSVEADSLSRFRSDRSFSRGLDKISKQDQYAYCEQDNTFVKFVLSYDDPVHDRCLHLGSGRRGMSYVSLCRYYRRVVCIDPLLEEGLDSRASVFDPGLVRPGWDIVSDVAFGDDKGMVIGDTVSFINSLYDLCAGRLVVAKCNIYATYGNARGFFKSKVRPHNAECVVYLSPEGDLLDEIFSELRLTVWRANLRRNTRLFQQCFATGLKPPYVTSHEIRDILLTRHPCLGCPETLKAIKRTGRIAAVFQSIGGGRRGERWKCYTDVCSDPSFKVDGPHCILPASHHLYGSVIGLDPGFSDPIFSLRSILHSAKTRGLNYRFAGVWEIY